MGKESLEQEINEAMTMVQQTNTQVAFNFDDLGSPKAKVLLILYEQLLIELELLAGFDDTAKEQKEACQNMISLLKESIEGK